MSIARLCDGCGANLAIPRFELRLVGENGDSDTKDFCSKGCIVRWAVEQRTCDCSHGETCFECATE